MVFSDHTNGGGAPLNTKRGLDFSSEPEPAALVFPKISEEVLLLSGKCWPGLCARGDAVSDIAPEICWTAEHHSEKLGILCGRKCLNVGATADIIFHVLCLK